MSRRDGELEAARRFGTAEERAEAERHIGERTRTEPPPTGRPDMGQGARGSSLARGRGGAEAGALEAERRWGTPEQRADAQEQQPWSPPMHFVPDEKKRGVAAALREAKRREREL